MLTDLTNKNVVHIKTEKIEYLQFNKLLEYKNIINHAYSLGKNVNFRMTINDGKKVSSKSYRFAKKSYQYMCKAINCKYKNIVKPIQCHTKNVKIIKNKTNIFTPDLKLKKYYAVDGLITNKKNIVISTTNADCILFLLFDPVNKVIANIHSGWKGTLQRIIAEAINKMVNKFKSNPNEIICCICPSIRKCHFEVDKDVKDKFEKEFITLEGSKYINEDGKEVAVSLNDFIEKRHNKWHIDTVLINKIIMQNIGLLPENIIDSEICSLCNSNIIHSYRNEKENYGLETALIEIRK